MTGSMALYSLYYSKGETMPEPIIGLSELVSDPRPAISALRDFVTGANPDYLEAIHASIDMASFTLRQFHTHPTFGAVATSCTESSREKAKQVLEHFASMEGDKSFKYGVDVPDFSAVDWGAILPLIIQLVSLLLAKK